MKAVTIAVVLMTAIAESSGASELPVKLTVWLSGSATVEAVVENQTSRQLDVAVSSALVLGASELESYWAPFDPMSGIPYDMSVQVCPGKPLPPEPKPPRLKLGPRESRRVTIRLREVKWAKSISSVWPDRPLDEVVPPGRYPLVWELFPYDSSNELRSTSVTVTLARE